MTPRQRPLRRDDLGIEITLRNAAEAAPAIELGWSVLRQEMRDAGWRTRTPEGDRKPATGPHSDQSEASCIDYGDPTGDMALRLDNWANDLAALEDHWHLVATSFRAMALIARKYVPLATPAAPACAVTTCDNPVESTGGSGYRGMERIAGHWVAKPGVQPTCATHRFVQRRAGAA